MVRKRINQFLQRFGFEIHKVRTETELARRLSHARRLGLRPKTIIDVGAAWGEWSVQCSRIFSDARYILVEPLQEFSDSLRKTVKDLPDAIYIKTALASEGGEVTMNVHPDLEGSSVYLEEEDSDVNGVPRIVPATTLDTLCASYGAVRPYLIKIDVQGAELDVLTGAEQALQNAEYVILETSLFESCKGVPLIHDVIAFMKSKGFVLYDVVSRLYRPLDNALCQVVACFVREHGFLRREHVYATREQREQQTRIMRMRYNDKRN